MANSLKYGRTLTIRTDNTTHNPHYPQCHYIPCGPSQCLPHPRSPTHHLSPIHSTLVITFLSPTLCHTHPPSSSHSTFCPHTLLLPSHSNVHPSLSPCTTIPCVPPSAPSTAQCHSLTASLFPTLTYSLFLPTLTHFFFIQLLFSDSFSSEDGGSKILQNVS
jgi:hypothetical protein